MTADAINIKVMTFNGLVLLEESVESRKLFIELGMISKLLLFAFGLMQMFSFVSAV